MHSTLADAIKEIRIQQGLSQAEFGQLVQASQQVVQNWEKGRHKPNPDIIRLMAEKTGVPICRFFGGPASGHDNCDSNACQPMKVAS